MIATVGRSAFSCVDSIFRDCCSGEGSKCIGEGCKCIGEGCKCIGEGCTCSVITINYALI